MTALDVPLRSKRFRVVAIVLLSLVFLLRLVMLDQDLPPWGLTNYTPVDEGSYSILALNLVNRGSIAPDTGLPFYTPPHVRVNVLGNVMSYLGLTLLGDNYYGLRAPYVLFGAVNFLFFYLILQELRKRYGTGKPSEHLWILGAMAYLALDFSFFIASRVAEPTMVRLLLIQCAYYAYIKVDDPKRRFFLLGLLVTLSVFLVYITNAFLYLACAAALLHIGFQNGKKRFWQAAAAFTAGCLSIFLLSELYFKLVWDTTTLKNFLASFTDFSTVLGYTSSSSVEEALKTLARFFSANSMIFNLPVLAGFLISLPVIVTAYLREKDDRILFGTVVMAAFLLQTLFSQDYIERKLLAVYPLFIYNVFLALYFKEEFIEKATSWRSKIGPKAADRILLGYLFLLIAFISAVSIYRILIVSDGTREDLSLPDILSFLLLGLLPVVTFLLYCARQVKCLPSLERGKMLYRILLVILCSVLMNSIFTVRYVFLNPTFTERDAMKSLGELAGEGYVLGEYENGFTLYNDIIPVLDTYKTLREHMENDPTLLYFDYSDQGMYEQRYFFDEILFEGSEYTVIPVAEFEREFQTFGKKRSMALYRRVTKAEAVAYYRAFFESLDTQQRIELAHAQFDHGGYIPGAVKTDVPSKAYPDLLKDYNEHVTGYLYGDVLGDIHGDVLADVFGDVYGDIYGNLYGNIFGDLHGKIYGTIYGQIHGSIVAQKGDFSR